MKQRHRLHVTIYQQNVNSLRNIVEKMYTLLNVVKKLVENAYHITPGGQIGERVHMVNLEPQPKISMQYIHVVVRNL